jgi:hypothetical protein
MNISLLTELDYCLGFSGYEYVAPNGAELLFGILGYGYVAPNGAEVLFGFVEL